MYLIYWAIGVLATAILATVAVWKFVDVFTWWGLLYAIILIVATSTALFIVIYPRVAIRKAQSSRRDEIVAVIRARNEIRTVWAQLFAGIGFVATFLFSLYNFNRDFTLKHDQAVAGQQAAFAEQYGKAMSLVSQANDQVWRTIGAFNLLDGIAKRDATYHAPVYNTLIRYLVDVSRARCRAEADGQPGYQIGPDIQAAAQILVGRNVGNDDPYHDLNLDGVCLSGVKLLDAKGLRNTWLRNARFLHADLRNMDLTDAKLSGAISNVMLHPQWMTLSIRNAQELFGLPNDIQERITTNAEGATLISANLDQAHFEGTYLGSANLNDAKMNGIFLQYASLNWAHLRSAKLSKATLIGAEAKGADFTEADLDSAILASTDLDGAVFSWTNVSNVDFMDSNITADQILKACVSSGPPKNLAGEVASVVLKSGGIRNCAGHTRQL